MSSQTAARPAELRVCFVTAEFPPHRGGVGDYTAILARTLAEQGVTGTVLTGTTPADGVADPPGVAVRREVPGWGWGCWSVVLRTVARDRPDVLHIQYQTGAYGMHPAVDLLPLRLRVLRARPRVVTTFHDLKVPYLFPKAGRLRHLPGRLLRAASDTVVLTNEDDLAALTGGSTGTGLGGWGPGARRLHVIPIGSNIPIEPTPDSVAWRARFGIGPREPLVAYFGFVNEWKGVDALVEALALLRRRGQPARLVAIGGELGSRDRIGGGYAGRVRARVAELGLGESVVSTGYLADRDVSAGLGAADVVALPFRDGACLRHGTLVAALAHARPIVTTRPRVILEPLDLPRLRDGESALLVPPGDHPALADALARALTDDALRARLAAGAAGLADRLTWPGIAADHRALYARLTAR